MEDTLNRAATLVIKLGYRGEAFSGFAEQKEASTRTVAGELRRALETRLHRPVELSCAGRTDAGVHALAQYVSLPVSAKELAIPEGSLLRSLAALTPDDISIAAVMRANTDFSARFDALSRSYRYRIADTPARPVHTWDYSWHLGRNLDEQAMDEAARVLIGEHNFASFAKTASLEEGKSSSREVKHISVMRIVEAGEELVSVDVCANAFLHNMVRNIVGSLVEVGRGHREPAWIAEVLEARDRRVAGPCAPARGLTLEAVDYPPESFSMWGEM